RSLSVFQSARWMNFPGATYLAESKPYQLKVAKEVGFSVPATAISNDAKAIQQAFQRKLIVKSLDTVLLRQGGDCLFTYTTIDNTDDLSEDTVAEVPFIAQEYLANKTDVRVTVIGNEVFAVRILPKTGCIEGDWRVIERENLRYEDFELDA